MRGSLSLVFSVVASCVVLIQAQRCNGLQDEHSVESDDPELNSEGWSSVDRLLLPPCMGLIKVCVKSGYETGIDHCALFT